MSLVFPENNPKWKLTLSLTFHCQSDMYLTKFWFLSYEPNSLQPIKLQYSFKFNISRKKRIMNFIFGMHINIEVFYKLIISFWVCVARHAQSTQNKKLVYLWNISRKMWGIETDCMFYCVTYTFRVNLQSSVAWKSRNVLLKTAAISEV